MGQRVSCPSTSSSISIVPVSSTACEGELVGARRKEARLGDAPADFPKLRTAPCCLQDGSVPFLFGCKKPVTVEKGMST